MDTFFCFLTIAGSFYNAPSNIFLKILFQFQQLFSILRELHIFHKVLKMSKDIYPETIRIYRHYMIYQICPQM